jgi:predicted DsbA family dithiol-disulfide isomerase
MSEKSVSVCYYSDLLCIWAYVAQARLDELRGNFPGAVAIEHRFVSIFGDTRTKPGGRWADRGGLEGYGRHVREVAERFGHVEVHPEIWTRNVPDGSFGCHAFVRGVALLVAEGAIGAAPEAALEGRPPIEELAWRLRLAFFRDLRNIARLDVQVDVAGSMDLPVGKIRERIEDGSALAALAADHERAASHQISGSPTFMLNEGRQKLYGNVGYRIIEANVQELLRDNSDKASWC